jgi:hypothetical protein
VARSTGFRRISRIGKVEEIRTDGRGALIFLTSDLDYSIDEKRKEIPTDDYGFNLYRKRDFDWD